MFWNSIEYVAYQLFPGVGKYRQREIVWYNLSVSKEKIICLFSLKECAIMKTLSGISENNLWIKFYRKQVTKSFF